MAALVLFLALGLAAAAVPASAVQVLAEVHRHERFLMQALLQAAAGDVTGAGRTELVVSGRNYETQENYVFLLHWADGEFQILWQSPNLWEPVSHLAMAVGDFTGMGRAQIAVLTRTKLRLFAWRDGRMQLIHEEPGWGAPEEIGVVRHPDHPYDLIAISQQHTVEQYVPQKGVELLGWRNGRFRLLWETPTMGRVRAIAGGDVNGDGRWELIVETGVGNSPGTVQVWRWGQGGYEPAGGEALRQAPVFALAAAQDGDRHLVALADDRGRAALYRFGSGFQLTAENSRSLGWAVTSVAAGDFIGDGTLQLVVLGYPSRLHVLQLNGKP
ncbi:MAG: hypothetical protein DIU82_06885 [Bacillota bacterium]|nr:hypothetical protein [Bacillota bacterium]REJ35707.1 MAG: hypothetical protein DIU82_06885 [Bacillota bacterium]